MASDLFHIYGTDLSVSATGDILIATGTVAGQQRVIRRLLTNPQDDFFNVTYGAGLGQFIGQPAQEQRITAVTKANMYKESVVQQNPPPAISITDYNNGQFVLGVQYVDAVTQQQSALTLPMGEN